MNFWESFQYDLSRKESSTNGGKQVLGENQKEKKTFRLKN